MTPAPGIVVVGEALLDVLPDGTRRVGGSPLNVAVGLARLGVRVTLVTALGDDPDGDLVRAHLDAAGVALVAAALPRTSTATVRYEGVDARYDLDLLWDLGAATLPSAEHLHVGSLGAVLEPGAAVVRRLLGEARERGTSISYDPNLRPDVPAPGLRSLAAVADLVKLSEDDAHLLAPGDPVEDTARSLLAGVTRAVVLTRGANGSTAFTADARIDVPAVPVDVVDTVGAGDAFMAGLLSTDPAGSDVPGLRQRLGAGAASAALSCSRAGA